MAKKFDIHEWQAKYWLKNQLTEADDFTPDLEDDELKRSKVQQMMAKEKGNATPVDGGMNQGDYDKVVDLLDRYSLGELLDAAVEFYQNGGEDESAELANKFATDFRKFLDSKDGELNENEENIPELSDQEKDKLHDMVMEFARKLTDVRGGNYSGDRLLAALQHVTLEIENLEPMIYDDEDEDGIPDELENDEELDEQNVTGTGASFTAGDGAGYATPSAFSNDEDDWKNKNMVYEDEELPPPPTDDKGNPIDPEAAPQDQTEKELIDTAKELGQQLKSFGKEVTTPKGGKGFDSSEIEVFSDLLIQLKDAIKNGNASSLLGRIKNLLN